MDFKRIIDAHSNDHGPVTLSTIYTPWGEHLDSSHVLEEHPRPQCRRDAIVMLNGEWEYAFSDDGQARTRWRTALEPGRYDGTIVVPFSPEAPLSGVQRQLKPDQLLWYKRTFEKPDVPQDGHCLLHFDAVDYCCRCLVNGREAGTHVGGYIPFTFDITDMLEEGQNTLTLCVFDPSDNGTQPRGKQMLDRGGIWYTATSGIWEPVWLEVVPESYVADVLVEPDAALKHLIVAAELNVAKAHEMHPLQVVLKEEDGKIAAAGMASPEPGGDDCRGVRTVLVTMEVENPRLWSPEDPYLYDVEIRFADDVIKSYCAFRTASMMTDEKGFRRFCLNGKPFFLKGVLDQGYWPDGLLTPPSDEALIYDIRAMKELGFNMMRKHIKVENARWYYHCDKMGMLVWQDMVFGGKPLKSWHINYKPTFFRFTWGSYGDDTHRHQANLSSGDVAYQLEWIKTCKEAIKFLRNHPSIVTWVLFNEGWGQFSAKKATKMVRSLDPTRTIDSVSGWYDQRCGDFLSVHNYFRPLEVYRDRGNDEGMKRAFVISEFGGYSYHVPENSVLEKPYGYGHASELSEFQEEVRKALAAVDALEEKGLAGYVYTQLSDVEEETNGLLTYDRRVDKMETVQAPKHKKDAV